MTLGENVRDRRVALKLSQAELGRRAGVSQQAIMGIETGRALRSRHLADIALALETTVEQLVAEDAAQDRQHEVAHAIEFRNLPKDVPVLGQAMGGDDGDFYFNGDIIDYIRRPPGIANMKDVFGLYAAGTSMWPRFEEGEPIYISPSRPAAIGDYVVLELLPEKEGDRPAGFLKRLKRRSGSKVVCEQFNPPKDIEYERDRIKSIFRVIPLTELVGF